MRAATIEISNQKGGPTAELRSSSRLIVRLENACLLHVDVRVVSTFEFSN